MYFLSKNVRKNNVTINFFTFVTFKFILFLSLDLYLNAKILSQRFQHYLTSKQHKTINQFSSFQKNIQAKLNKRNYLKEYSLRN
jgi:hypothetical protein